MAYTLADDEELIRKTVREFAQKEIGLERASDQDRFDRFPAESLQAAAALGLTGIADPSSGLGATAFVLAIDELAQVDPNAAIALAAHNAALAAAVSAQSSLVGNIAAGELASLLLAEEASGSDNLRPGTVAIPNAGGFKVTGQKVWGINAVAAKHFLVLAQVIGPGGGPTLLRIAADQEGVSLGENESLLGLRAAGIRTVYLSGVQVAADQTIGTAGSGLAAVAVAQTWMKLGAAAALCGCVAGGLEAAARFAESRIQFGQAIGTYQAVSDGLATIDVQLAAARALVLAAAGRVGQDDAHVWAARAKAFAAEMAVPMTRQAIRVQGGTGFMREGGTERFARDARALQFVGETTQMQRDVLKRAILPNIPFPLTP